MNLVFAFVFLPLLTRPAAPRLATWGSRLTVETCRPHMSLIVPQIQLSLTQRSSQRTVFVGHSQGDSRVCYALLIEKAALTSIKMAKTKECRAATFSGSRS